MKLLYLKLETTKIGYPHPKTAYAGRFWISRPETPDSRNSNARGI